MSLQDNKFHVQIGLHYLLKKYINIIIFYLLQDLINNPHPHPPQQQGSLTKLPLSPKFLTFPKTS